MANNFSSPNNNQAGDNNEINKILKNIAVKMNEIEDKISSQNFKIKSLENKIDSLSLKGNTAIESEMSAPPPPPPPEKIYVAEKLEKILQVDKFAHKEILLATDSQGENSQSFEAPVLPPTPEEIKKVSDNLEEKIGGKWFAKIGIAILILGVSFFLKYAFDNNWIGPTGRVIMGILTGLGLLAFGEKTIRKYNLYGQIVTGGGLAILYLSIYAAFNFYDLIPSLVAFLFMALVTGIGIALALRYDAMSLITLSVAGGFATPYLASSGVNNQIGLFSYIIMLDLAVLAVSIFKKWRWLNALGLVGTFIIFSGWYSAFYSESQLMSTLFFASLFFIIYSISSLIYNLVKKENSTGFEQIMTLFTGLIYFGVSYNLLDPVYHTFLGLFTMILAIYYFLWAYLVRSLTPDDNYLYNFLAFLSIGFITVAIPIQFEKYIITVCWTIESVLLLYLGVKLRDKSGEAIKIFGFVVFVMSICRVLLVDHDNYGLADIIFFNKVFISALLAILGAYLVIYLFKKYIHEASDGTIFESKKIIPLFIVLASFITVFAASREVVQYHNNLVAKEYKAVELKNQEVRQLHGNFSGYLIEIDQDKVNGINERRDVFLYLFWYIYAAVLLVLGVYKKNRYLIIISTVINLAATVKILLIDLWLIKSYFRSLISYLGVSFSYLAAFLFKENGKISGYDDKFINSKKLMAVFLILANLLTILAISREIYVYFDKKVNVLVQTMEDDCSKNYENGKFNYSHEIINSCEKKYTDQIESLTNKSSVGMSLFWLIYSIILVIIGFAKKYKWVRIGGICLLLISILKLFFIDLWSLGQLYRIIASISLGMVLMGVSFAYQKYKNVFQEIIK